jgi:hypothetical protein
MINATDDFDPDAAFAHIPVPAGAETDSESWTQNLQRPGYSRSLTWAKFPADGISVYIDGRQEGDGSFTRQISLYEDALGLTADGARRLAFALIKAADTLKALR